MSILLQGMTLDNVFSVVDIIKMDFCKALAIELCSILAHNVSIHLFFILRDTRNTSKCQDKLKHPA